MSYLMRLHGFLVECDTPDEVLRLAERVHPGSILDGSNTENGITLTHKGEVAAVLRAMAEVGKEGAPAPVIYRAFGLEGTAGMGPKAAMMKRVLRDSGNLDINAVRIVKERRGGNRWLKGPLFNDALYLFGIESGQADEQRPIEIMQTEPPRLPACDAM